MIWIQWIDIICVFVLKSSEFLRPTITHCLHITIKSRSVLILQVVRENCWNVFVRFSSVWNDNSDMSQTIVLLYDFHIFQSFAVLFRFGSFRVCGLKRFAMSLGRRVSKANPFIFHRQKKYLNHLKKTYCFRNTVNLMEMKISKETAEKY